MSNHIYSQNKNYFDLCFSLNSFAHKTKFEYKCDCENGQEVIATLLVIKILNGYQAIYLLSGKGLTTEANILLRTILEALFILKLCCDDKNFIPEYVKTDAKNRLKMMNIARQDLDPVFDSLRNYATEEIRKTLADKISKENINDLIVEQIAIRAGMHKQYNGAWRLLSSDVHTTPRALEKYAVADNQGNINRFIWGPRTKDINFILLTSAEIIFGAMDLTTKLFKIDKKKELEDFWTKMSALKIE